MKRTLHIAILLSLIFPALNSAAQVTRLAQNNNIVYGVPLGTTGILVDSTGALWKTDGTSGGTIQYTSKVLVDSFNTYAILNNKIYFTGIDASHGAELWVTDGTDAGTSLVKDIETGSGNSTPEDITLFNNALYFFATTTAAGEELWRSDGTSGGTVMVKDINPGAASSYSSSILIPLNGILFFNANDGTNGNELWKTDGTSGGTVMVKDINPSGSSDPSGLTSFGSSVIFSANDGTTGTELWKTDGTSGGTVQVKDIQSGSGSSNPSQFLLFNSKIYFITVTGFPLTKSKLWMTDGTNAGTTQVYDFGNLSTVLLTLSVFMNNKFYFSALTASSGLELWSSDGTNAGTSLFMDINPGVNSSSAFILPDFLGAAYNGADFHTRLYNGKIFFTADDGTHGTELWITDGTVGGTSMVKDVNSGSNSSVPSFFTYMYTTSGLYYPADDGTHGNELWKSDGTSGGTAIVKDVNPGSNSSDPYIFLYVNNHIYFTGDDNSDGATDLYIVDASVTLPSTLLNFTATLTGKVAQLQWTTATEINTKNFVVQRSIDATHFDNIGTVNAVGNSTQKTTYQFTDAGALSSGGNKVYYRLQMVDKDGKFAYSKIATLTIVNGKLYVIYPNPVKDQLLVTTNTSLSKAEIRITDINGKIVYKQEFENLQAGTQNKVNVSSLGKGIYYLQFINGSDVQSTKFIKE